MIEWLLSKLAYMPRTTKPEELEERVDSIVARVDVLEERVESIERDLPEHDEPHAHA
jgi:hypothetical protein